MPNLIVSIQVNAKALKVSDSSYYCYNPGKIDSPTNTLNILCFSAGYLSDDMDQENLPHFLLVRLSLPHYLSFY